LQGINLPIKKKEHKHQKVEPHSNTIHQANTNANQTHRSSSWAIISSTIMMVFAYPIGIYTITGWILTLGKTAITFGSSEHIFISAGAVIIIALLGLFGAKAVGVLHKLALLAIFISIPFGFYKIIKTILFGYSNYYNEIAIAFGIIFFLMIILVFKRNTD
jgi:hypothetical protein